MIQILLGSFRPELQQEVTSIVPVLTPPRLHFKNAHEKYRKTITRDFNSLHHFQYIIETCPIHYSRDKTHVTP